MHKAFKVPKEMEPLFEKAQACVRDYFQDRVEDPAHGTISCHGERYIKIRAAAMSAEFFDAIKSIYHGFGEVEVAAVSRQLLFDVAHALGKADAKAFAEKMGLTSPLEKLSVEPIIFSHMGWSFVDISPESHLFPDDSFYLLAEHQFSFESDEWIKSGKKSDCPVCVMGSGYSSGWCEESFGVELVTSEILCKASGDEVCRFIMAPPNRIEGHVQNYFRKNKLTSNRMPKYDIAVFPKMEADRATLLGKTGVLEDINTNLKIYEEMFRNSPNSIVMVDYHEKKPTFLRTNPAFERIYGYSQAETFGQSSAILKSGKTPLSVYKKMWSDVLNPNIGFWHGEITNKKKDGTFIEVILSINTLFDAAKRPVYFVASHIDVTAANKDKRGLKASLAELGELRDVMMSLLEDTNEAKIDLEKNLNDLKLAQQQLVQAGKMSGIGQMAAGIAHEINNPLTTILGFAQLTLAKKSDDEDLMENLLTIEGEAKRCVSIIENLLGFARPTPSERRVINLNTLIEPTVKLVRYMLEREGVEIKIETGKELPAVTVDPQKISQVLVNLFMNAQHAMPKGGVLTIATHAVTRKNKNYVCIDVRDTGIGMDEELKEKIFEPFFTTAFEEGRKGTGLGLAVSHTIVLEHGGFFDVESSPGQGSTFSMYLPVDAV